MILASNVSRFAVKRRKQSQKSDLTRQEVQLELVKQELTVTCCGPTPILAYALQTFDNPEDANKTSDQRPAAHQRLRIYGPPCQPLQYKEGHGHDH